jgi:molybdopterin molybdotransferase
MRKLNDDCFVPGQDRLRHDDAIALLRARVSTVSTSERVELDAAAGRILAEPAVARLPVPAHTNAAVDGYSFAAGDYDGARGAVLPVEGRAAAGRALAGIPGKGSAARIFTGAMMPEGHDTVVMQEDVTIETQGGVTRVRIPGGLKAGANRRKAGEDVAAGTVLMDRGHVLRAQDLAALASIGFADVAVYRPLSVAILSTGDEVIRSGRPLAAGQVYDANAPMLAGLVGSAGATLTDLGVAPDDAAALQRTLKDAAQRFDAVLTSGGASRGEEDHMSAALDVVGKRHLWQLAIKPGRPMSFGQIGDSVVVGLPGNPVAVFVCFLLYVWPLLRRLNGAHWPEPVRYQLPAAFAFTGRKPGRREFWRGILKQHAGTLQVDKFARDGSGLISGLRAADGLIDIPEDHGDVKPGDLVAFIPFSEFGIISR